jgi:RimJ/RimL family protein N-acetyltransferase
METTIRRAVPEDAPRLASVEVATWRAAYRGLMPDDYLESLSEVERAEAWRENLLKHGPTGRKRVLVAESEGEVVGFVRVGVVAEPDEVEVGLVYLLYVRPDNWSRGLGWSLMRGAMDELRNLGARDAILWVLDENARARRFYEMLGWREDGRTSEEHFGGTILLARRYRRSITR